MADDYSINAKITADASGYEAGVKKAQKASQTLSKSVSGVIQGLGKSGLVGALGAVGLATGGVTAIIGVAKKAFQAVSKAINETTEAYKTQYKAEIALETVAKNNPYIDGTNVIALKNFASEIQSISNYGDEELLPLISNLTALGRTQEQTMEIIKVATDMASTEMVSLDTAVNQLNMTLNGNIGRLGIQNAELKTLTEEELKSGKAVEILGKKYEGLAKVTADSSIQLKNAIGDFKEIIGETFENALAPMRKWFTEVITNTNNAINSAREQKKAYAEVFGEDNNQVNLNAETEKLKSALDSVLDEQRRISTNYRQYLSLYGEYINKETDETLLAYESRIRDLNKKIAELSKELTKRKNESNAEAERRRQAQADAEAEQKLIDLKEEYLKKIAEQEAKWENIRKVTGEAVSNEEKIKFYQDSLVDLMTKAEGQITTNNQLYKDQIAIIQRLQSELEPEEEEKESSNTWAEKIREQTIERLEAEKQAELERLESRNATELEIFNTTSYYNDKLRELNRQSIEEEREQALKSVEGYANALEEKERINKYYDNLLLDNNLKFVVAVKKQDTAISKNFAEVFKKVLASAKDMTDKVGKVFSGIANTVKSIFSKGKSIFSKLFDFNQDEALDKLLKFEDKVLTFFVETMPKLPQFIASAFESIATLLNTIFDNIDFENLLDGLVKAVVTVLKNIPKLIVKAIPKVFKAIGTLFKEFRKLLPELLTVINGLIEEIFKSLPNFVQVELPAFLKDIASFIPTFMKAGSEFVKILVSALPNIVQTILDAFILLLQDPKAIADLVVAIIKAFVEVIMVIVRNIGPLLKALLPAIATIIIEIFKALPELLWSLTKEIGSMILDVGKWIVNLIIDGINKMLDGISKVWTWIPGTKGIPHIPHFANGTDNAPSGLALVGEAGPELVKFNGGEKVLNNRNTQKLLAGGNAGNTFNVTFNNLQDTSAYAMMSQLRQYNRQMAINGII